MHWSFTAFLSVTKLNLHTQHIPHRLCRFFLRCGGDMGAGVESKACRAGRVMAMVEFTFAKWLQNGYNQTCLRETNLIFGRSNECSNLIAACFGRCSASCSIPAAEKRRKAERPMARFRSFHSCGGLAGPPHFVL